MRSHPPVFRKLLASSVTICAAGIFCGCTHFSPRPNENETTRATGPIVRLADSNIGMVAKANSEFAVLVFPFGIVPGNGQRLNVYRDGKKVGELKVTGPQRDFNTIADIISGNAQVNDEVRTD